MADFLSVGKNYVAVPLSTLILILGPPRTMARVKNDNHPTMTEREWKCGCTATTGVDEDNLAHWRGCGRHKDVLLSRSVFQEIAEAGGRRWWPPEIPSGVAQKWAVPVLTLNIALTVGMLVEYSVSLKRAKQAEDASLIDALTGLYNRRGWDRRVLEEANRLKRSREPAAIIILDVDGLKIINDSKGHAAGDAALRQVADVLRDVTRENDIAARLGGDEFGLFAPDAVQTDGEIIIARLQRGFAQASLSVSVGIAYVDENEKLDAAIILADREMYKNKNRTR
jgi:diguanylate cyclase (GGDEF)-like protein